MADALALSRAPFGQGSGSILERTYCTGSELKLINCPISDYPDYYTVCDHSDDAAVQCCKSLNTIYLVYVLYLFYIKQYPVVLMVLYV